MASTNDNSPNRETNMENDTLNAILESTADGILVLTNDRKIIRYNNNFVNIFEIPKEILDTMDDNRVMEHAEIQLVDPQEFRKTTEEIVQDQIEKTDIIVLKNGKIFERFYKPLVVEGEIKGRVWSLRDITKQTEIINNLRVKEQIIETSLNAIIYTDFNGKVLYANDSFLKLWGYDSLDEVIDKMENEFFLLDSIEQTREAMDQNKRWHGERLGIRKNGSTFEAKIFGSEIQDIKGNIIFKAASIINISKRKEAERNLEKSEALYKKLIEFLPDAVFVHKGNKIVITNQQGIKLSKYESIEDVIGLSLHEVVNIHTKYRERVEERRKQLLEEETAVDFLEQEIVLPNGSRIDIEVGATSFFHDDEMYITSVARDISERKKAELLTLQIIEKQKEIDKAKEYDEIKTQFFSTVSHELKTPLNVILGATQLLKTLEIDDIYNSGELMNRYIKIMMQNCFRLLRLINNLIDITRIDSGFLKMDFNNYNIVSVVEEITLSVAEYIKSKNIKLIFDTEIEEKLMACDADKIERVMLNLFSNAIKYTGDEGVIKVDIHDKGNNIVISVKDTGIGIPPEMLEKIFERFSQVDSSLTRKTEGSGIGLSLVQSIIELHGGDIKVVSELGKGSEFIITLPVKQVETRSYINNKIADIHETKVDRLNIEFSDIYS